jgi:hypothetical protein
VHEDLDEVTGLSRLIIVDSPDEKKQPTIEIKAENGQVMRRYIMPVKIDHLRGLKENVTMGRLIPAGTGFWWYRRVQVPSARQIMRRDPQTQDLRGGMLQL